MQRQRIFSGMGQQPLVSRLSRLRLATGLWLTFGLLDLLFTVLILAPRAARERASEVAVHKEASGGMPSETPRERAEMPGVDPGGEGPAAAKPTPMNAVAAGGSATKASSQATGEGAERESAACNALAAKLGVTKLLFAQGEATLSADRDAEARLASLVEGVRKTPGARLVLFGHTDDRGGIKYNAELSRQRADAVARYLGEQGVERAKMRVIPLGSRRPAVTGGDESSRASNRRVEISIQCGGSKGR